MRIVFGLLLISGLTFAQHSAGRAPAGVSTPSVETPRGGLMDVDIVGAETQTGFNYGFTSSAPGTLSSLCAVPDIANFPGAGDFANDPNIYYIGNNTGALYSIALDTCATNLIGTATLNGGETYSGFAWCRASNTMYASSTNITASSLYTLDLNTGAATLIGPITGSPCAIALACDNNGQLYTYDICDDNFYAVNSGTGAASLIGPIGFDANFGQGLTYDAINNVMYMAAFNGGSFAAELRTVDLGTGNSTFVGTLGSVSPTGLLQMASIGLQSMPVQIPTLSQWGLIAFITLLLSIAVIFSIRRRRQVS